jgi:hypothetical protein
VAEITSGQAAQRKERAATTARGCLGLAVICAVGSMICVDMALGGLAAPLAAVACCCVPIGAIELMRSRRYGEMVALAADGLCPHCARRVVEAWRVSGRGVRCPECGELQGTVEHQCRACRYDMSGCPVVGCEPVTRLECGLCKGVYVVED